ncbi:hydroperoxide isomerase ALOXE3-like [Sphaeramia orbicularis]|nr:hydroperoxide isomerase ALOXE3-like [Sphaeramia orbicularis]
MAKYKLDVTTGDMDFAGTWDYVFLTLIGANGESERTELSNFGLNFQSGTTGTYTITTPLSLGRILLIKVEKDPNIILPENEWYFSKVVVTTPEGDVILFPCFRWMNSGEVVELRGGRAMKIFEDDHPILSEHRKNELMQRKNIYGYEIKEKGIPYFTNFRDITEIPGDIRLSKSKIDEMMDTKRWIGLELGLKGLFGSPKKWESFEDMTKIFWRKKTQISEYVTEHWREDAFYGSQYLNGVNPGVMVRCSELPPNFPVTDEMVKPFLEEGTTLKEEMEKGNIFLSDKKIMDRIPTRSYEGKPIPVTPGLCLFYLNPQRNLMPIAIQLYQEPSEKNPIFLPSDSETDWLLAKMFFKNADFNHHQAIYHLMSTHFLAEVYNIATMRCLPVIHPIFKLLIPHFRYIIYTNVKGRNSLFSPTGPLSISSLGYDGLMELMRRGLNELKYSNLIVPENITERGLDSIPNFYYRDDGLKLWDIINRFVRKMVEYYYPSDDVVTKDVELQDWIGEIFKYGFLSKKETGVPDSFNTVEEVIKFITMIIFYSSGQHAAVNNGQFDYLSWVPNGSLLLVKSPPHTKGQSTERDILESVPNVGDTVSFVGMAWMLSLVYKDFVPLGTFPEERFDEPTPKQFMKEFHRELILLTDTIDARNALLDVPYYYLNPNQIENSITI